MNLKKKMNDAIAKKAGKGYTELLETFKSFEDHLIQIQKNQAEFEEYLKRIEEMLNKK